MLISRIKKSFAALSVLFAAFNAPALPGVSYSVPDFSGQYVYYQDKSFERESYIGIIYYDDSTYGIRYFAPTTGKDNTFKAPKSVNILFTLDSSKDYVELTGERITTVVTPDDTDLINYIHDFLYEMTSRRQKAGDITQITKVNQIYEQFGGDVTLEFDPIVPVTNLRSITNGKETQLQIVTAGQLISSTDTSFTDFEGITDFNNDKSASLKLKKTKSKLYALKNNNKKVSVSLDENWSQQAENFWLLGDSAVLIVNSVPSLSSYDFQSLKRRLILSSDHVYSDWRSMSFSEDSEKNFTVNQIFFNDLTGCFSNDYKTIDKISGTMISLTVYSKAFEANKKYFSNIIKSLKIN